MRLLKYKPGRLARIARRNRQEIIAAGLSRRDLFRMGLLTGAGYLVAKSGLSARASTGGIGVASDPESPPITPWMEDLVIPQVAQPVALSPAPAASPVAGEFPRGVHQHWNTFLPQHTYELAAQQFQHSFHPQYATNTAWGWGGSVPGKTIHARYGQPIVVRYRNNLPTLAQHSGFGRPEVSTHLHNAHVGSPSDGFPADFYATGVFKDSHYPNAYAGFASSHPGAGDPREALGTLWYHDHRLDFTSQNVYRGLAGFFFLFDDKDSGDETDTNPGALRLPSGEYDVPLMLADRVFDEDEQLYFDLFNLDGILGDRFLVNGKIQPRFKVARRKYRFRILNTGPSRFVQLYLSNGQSFVQIANDGNLLPAPVTRPFIRLSVAERADVIIDFSNANIGDQIYLVNRLKQDDGRGPDDDLLSMNQGNRYLRFDVDRDAADPSQVPATLRALPDIDFDEVVRSRTFDFERTNGAWAVNGEFFDTNLVMADPQINTAEIWTLSNNSGGWSHPIHIHFEEFQILSINGNPPPAHLVSRKDVVELGENTEVEVFVRFRDFTGRYVMHCHNTIHEDHAMMIRWDVVP
jgi:FtsP/CotA-like multicopper oxidase with cupredoxin domain